MLVRVKVQPRARRPGLQGVAAAADGPRLRLAVTAVPEDGKATAAVVKLLSRALGVAPSRLTLVRGATARDKVFRVE